MSVPDFVRAKKRADKRVRERARAMQKLAREAGDPLADEIRQIREKRGSVTNLPVGDPIKHNPFVDGAMAAVKSRDEAADHQTEEALIFEQTAWKYAPPQQTEHDPKVLPFRQHSSPEQLFFATPIERFDFLRVKQRSEPLTDEEDRWLTMNRQSWERFAVAYFETWNELDQRWLAEMAPDVFGEDDREENGL